MTHSEYSVQDIQRFIPFDELSAEAIVELWPHFRFYRSAPKQILFKRGEKDDECHFLIRGRVDLADAQFRISAVQGDGDDNFLPLDGSHEIHRCAGVSQSDCELFAIKRQHLDLVTTWIELTQKESQHDEDHDWLETLLTSNLFSRIPPGNIQKLLSAFEERAVRLGDEIIREGEEGQECYIIKNGKALVSRLQNGKNETLAALGQGKLFGEDALISNLPRNATVTMSSDGTLMVLNKENFNLLLKTPVVSHISESELAVLIADGDTGTVLLDVRLNEEVAANPIHRAQAIPLAQLRSRIGELSHEFIYVLIGNARAEAAAYILSEAGFNAKVLKANDDA